MHRGDDASSEAARQAIDCLRVLTEDVVRRIAERMHFSWPRERWATSRSDERSPFDVRS